MNTKRLYESIMKNISKDIKKSMLNEAFGQVTNYVGLPIPVIELQNLVKKYPKKSNILIEQDAANIDKWRVYIDINGCSFEFYWTIYITMDSDPDAFDVETLFTVEGLDSEGAMGYMDINEFRTEVIDQIKESIKKPSLYNEYRAGWYK